MNRNRPVDPIVDLIKRLGLDIGVIKNLHGNVFDALRSILGLKRTGWYYVQLSATQPLTPREAYLKGANNVNPNVLPSDDGFADLSRIKDYEDGKGLFLYTGVDVRQPTQARITVTVPGTDIGVYVNDTLLAEGTGLVSKIIQLNKKDTIQISLYRRPANRDKVLILEGSITVPEDITIGLLPAPPDVPIWAEEDAIRFGFVDNTKQRQGLLLTWKDNPAAGGWFVQKTEFDALGKILSVEDNIDLANSVTFKVQGLHPVTKGIAVVSGTIVGIISSGVILSSGESLLDQITQIYVNTPVPFIPSGSFGGLPSGVTVVTAWTGEEFFESNPPSIIKDVDRQSPKELTITVPDEEIRFGFPYIYRLSAWHPFHKEVRSQFSNDNFINLPFEVSVEILSHRWVPSGMAVSGSLFPLATPFEAIVPIYFLELALHIGSGTKSLNFISEWEREHIFGTDYLSFDYNINVDADLDHRILASGASQGTVITDAVTMKLYPDFPVAGGPNINTLGKPVSDKAVEDKYTYHYRVKTNPGGGIKVGYWYRPDDNIWRIHSYLTFGPNEDTPVVAEKIIPDMGIGTIFGLNIDEVIGTGGFILPPDDDVFGVTFEVALETEEPERRAFFPPPVELFSPWDKINYVKVTPFSEPGGSVSSGIPGITKTIYVDTTESTGSGVALKQQDTTVRKGRAIETRPFFDGEQGPTGGPMIKVRQAYDAGVVGGSWTPNFENGPAQRVFLQADTTIEYPIGIISTETFHLYIETNGYQFTLANTSPGYIIPKGSAPTIAGLCHCNFIVNWRELGGVIVPGDLSGVILPDMKAQGQVTLEL